MVPTAGVTYVCPTQTQIRREILDAIVYPHLPGPSANEATEEHGEDDYNGPGDDEAAVNVATTGFNWWD